MRFFIFCIVCLVACRSEKPSGNPLSEHHIPQSTIDFSEYLPLITNIEELRVFDQAGIEGKELVRSTKGDTLYYLDESSDFTTQLTLYEQSYNAPWLKVLLPDQTEGWIYAAGVRYDAVAGKALSETIAIKHLYNYFGSDLGRTINDYVERFKTIAYAAEFADFYKQTLKLREQLCAVIREKGINEPLPDLLWQQNGLVGFVAAKDVSNEAYYLFFDYNSWQSLAKQTEGTADDEFIAIPFLLYNDGIEFFHENWLLPLDGAFHSLLGEGVHQKILKQLSSLNPTTQKYFESEITTLKAKVLNDILQNTSYWRSASDIIKELEAILKDQTLDIVLTLGEKKLLADRIEQFQQPQQFKIQLNKRDEE